MLKDMLLAVSIEVLVEAVLAKRTISSAWRTRFKVLALDALHAFFIALDDGILPRISRFIKDRGRRDKFRGGAADWTLLVDTGANDVGGSQPVSSP